MPAWLAILPLFELVIILTNPNVRDYAWLQGLQWPAWFTFHIWSPLIRLACNLAIDLSLLVLHKLLGSWNGAFAWVLFLIWTFVDHLAQWRMIDLNSVGNDHPSNRSVSSYRSFAKDVKRLKQSLTRSRRPR